MILFIACWLRNILCFHKIQDWKELCCKDTSCFANAEKILGKYISQLQNIVENTRCGYALALGAMPQFMLAGKLEAVLGGLTTASTITQKDQKMAQSRSDAIKALTGLASLLWVLLPFCNGILKFVTKNCSVCLEESRLVSWCLSGCARQ